MLRPKDSGYIASWVLTAGHEVVDLQPSALSFKVAQTTYAVVEIVLYSAYQPGGVLGHGGDLTLLRLKSPVTTIDPATLYSGNDELGRVGTTVGFGRSGAGASIITDPTPVGTKRAGQNRIDSIGGTIDGRVIPANLLVSDFDHPANAELNRIGEATPLDLEYCPVGGDSGGGLFIEKEGRWHLAGLVSAFTPKINDDLDLGLSGSLIYWTRLSIYADWIEEVIRS